MRAITTTVGPLATASATAIAASQSIAAAGGSLTLAALAAAIPQPRRITITSAGDDSAATWTVVGTNWAGNIISETFLGANTPTVVTSALSYASVTSISLSAASASTVTAGTSTVATSPWVRFDEWAEAVVGMQLTATGTVNFTFESSFDDPNSLINPVAPASMSWDSTISPVVGQTATVSASLSAAPLWGRILLNSGTGSVKGVFVQYLQVPTV